MSNPTHGTITISIETYDKLLEAERLLEALQQAGVDNWDGYAQAQEILEMEKQRHAG